MMEGQYDLTGRMDKRELTEAEKLRARCVDHITQRGSGFINSRYRILQDYNAGELDVEKLREEYDANNRHRNFRRVDFYDGTTGTEYRDKDGLSYNQSGRECRFTWNEVLDVITEAIRDGRFDTNEHFRLHVEL